MKPTIAIHGGAGTISRKKMTPAVEKNYVKNLQRALDAGYEILDHGGSALDAVQAAVIELENCPLFNAGKGSVYTSAGTHEMDAAIMDGKDLRAGAVAAVSLVKNPIELARIVMDKSGHVMLCGEGAQQFAKINKIKFESEEYFFNEKRLRQLKHAQKEGEYTLDHTEEKKFGTVGAVACDKKGNLAAATSTGGMTNKSYGRIGDSPIIGAGTYANNKTCAVSCTGHGEFFMRTVTAFDISCLMEYKGYSLKKACDELVHKKLKKLGGEGGLIAVDAKGNVYLPFNSEGMYRGWITHKSEGIEIF